MEKKRQPEQEKIDSKKDKGVSRRNFIASSALSAATIAVAGVGSAVAADPKRIQRSPGGKNVSPNVANLMTMALAEENFRQELKNNPEAAARSRGIVLSRDEVGVLQDILSQAEAPQTQRPRGPDGRLMNDRGCGYRGFN